MQLNEVHIVVSWLWNNNMWKYHADLRVCGAFFFIYRLLSRIGASNCRWMEQQKKILLHPPNQFAGISSIQIRHISVLLDRAVAQSIVLHIIYRIRGLRLDRKRYFDSPFSNPLHNNWNPNEQNNSKRIYTTSNWSNVTRWNRIKSPTLPPSHQPPGRI